MKHYKKYTVYLKKTMEVIASGDAGECAEAMGISVDNFYVKASCVNTGRNGKYVVEKMSQSLTLTGKRLKYARLRKELSVKEVADLAGILPCMVYSFEEGRRPPKPETLCDLADVLDVSMDYIMGRDPEKCDWLEDDKYDFD